MKIKEVNVLTDQVDGAVGVVQATTTTVTVTVTSGAVHFVAMVDASVAATLEPPSWSCSKSSPATATNSFKS
jgi:hypothetical protein